MFKKRLETLFGLLTLISILLLAKSWYSDYKFKNEPISRSFTQRLDEKEDLIKALIKKHYEIELDFPVIATNRLNSNLYGVAAYKNRENIKIFLNKRRMKESMDYMINDVLPHEYAHGLMFKLGYLTKKNGGHSKRWQEACIKLGGIRCNRYIDGEDIVMGKMPF